MKNIVMLVGRLAEEPTIIENIENNNIEVVITLKIRGEYQDINGDFKTDLIPCKLWNGIAKSTVEFVKKNDLIGVKGRLKNINGRLEVIAEKVSFLAIGDRI